MPYIRSVTETITIRTDEETEHALDVLTSGGVSRSAAVRKAVIQAAERRERAAELSRAVLAMDIGEPDGADVAAELARDRGDER
jgi:predicted transcriptional regulator